MNNTTTQCALCGQPANWLINQVPLCMDCAIEEHGLCAICGNDCKDKFMAVAACSEFTERHEAGKDIQA